jgi:predicted DNA-binding transcriptional regulator AlpA
MEFSVNDEKYITMEDVEKLVGLKESSIYMRVRFGHFPQPIKWEVRQAWKKTDIEEYLQKAQEGK